MFKGMFKPRPNREWERVPRGPSRDVEGNIDPRSAIPVHPRPKQTITYKEMVAEIDEIWIRTLMGKLPSQVCHVLCDEARETGYLYSGAWSARKYLDYQAGKAREEVRMAKEYRRHGWDKKIRNDWDACDVGNRCTVQEVEAWCRRLEGRVDHGTVTRDEAIKETAEYFGRQIDIKDCKCHGAMRRLAREYQEIHKEDTVMPAADDKDNTEMQGKTSECEGATSVGIEMTNDCEQD